MPGNPSLTIYKNNKPVLDLVSKQTGNILFNDTDKNILVDDGENREVYGTTKASEIKVIDKEGLVVTAGQTTDLQSLINYLSSTLRK